mmetsp:Transcript_10592/g.32558  ORF Transcript_10592/g.32558 Transcript_10592/m.32558 type:complete len:207 (+) Transcript_10592:2284-2904(+)|eukprot:scaffold163549_cov31-Tisochrysis_lutea.AAC.6
MKMTHGPSCRLALPNRSRTRAAPTPTYISTNSDPEAEMKGTPASPATARARSVLPVPGGPSIKAPRGIRAPSAANLSGFLRNSTSSLSSSLDASQPATSANVIPVSASSSRADVRPMPNGSNMEMPPPRAVLARKVRRKTKGKNIAQSAMASTAERASPRSAQTAKGTCASCSRPMSSGIVSGKRATWCAPPARSYASARVESGAK